MRLTYVGLFLLALCTLLVEVLLTRIFDVILSPNLSFLIVSCALFGLGLAGLLETLRPRRGGADGRATAGRTALGFAVSVWALPLLLNAMPFSTDQFSAGLATQLGSYLGLYLSLLLPFFLAGLCICRLFAERAHDIQRLYFWDLSGAALGSSLLIPLLPALGPERLLVGVALVALLASACFAASPRWCGLLLAVGAVFLAVPRWIGDGYLTLALHDNKRDVQTSIARGQLEFSRWDPVSQISVVDQPPLSGAAADRGKKHVAYDGGTQSSHFFPFDGDFAALRRDLPQRMMYSFWQRGVLASHYLHRDTGHSALIIGSAGGQETKAALLYGAAQIDAVEMVPTVVELGTGRYAGYLGGIFLNPAVALRVGEGRSFLRASRKTYDVIQIFSNHTSSSVAAGSGALAPVYLQTREAYAEYFSHLKPDGILQINHHVYPRMIATAAAAWRSLGRGDFRSHVVVFEKRPPVTDSIPTVLIQMSPWSAAQIADLQQFFGFEADGEPPYDLVENPLDPAASFLSDDFYSGALPAALVRAAPYALGVVTDDRPYFNFLRRSPRLLEPDRAHALNLSTAAHLNASLRRGWLPMDWFHLIAAAGAGALYGLLFVLLPLLASRAGRERWTGKAPALCYFSLLGLGFIAIELLFIQIFMELIGYPLYSIATVITVMLIGAALGSATSRRIAGEDSRRWHVAFTGLLASGLAVWLGYPAVSSFFMAMSTPIRIAAAAGLMFPLAYFMGMPFPLGILELRSKPRGAVAWAWSMNGLFSTIGGVASVLLSLLLGFRWSLLAALGVYALAWALFAALRSANRSDVGELEEEDEETTAYGAGRF